MKKLTWIEDESECWIFQGTLTKYGYGVIPDGYKQHAAHRLSYEIHKGSIPKGLLVIHSCDQPSCINPDHLRIGTQKDNMTDMVKRGRSPHSKLRERDVIEMRRLWKDRHQPFKKVTQQELATLFGVCQATVHTVVTRQSWCHLE